jgi:hypothetical protein
MVLKVVRGKILETLECVRGQLSKIAYYLQIICTYVYYRKWDGEIKEKVEGLRAQFQIGNPSGA